MPGVLRQATPRDADAILNLHGDSWTSPDRTDLLTGRVRSGDCLVCEIDGDVVGFTTISPRSFFGRDFVELLVVDARHRRAGVGRELLHAALRHATTSEIFTSTNRSNLAMLALLRDEGWQLSGELTGIDEGDPEVVFFRSSSAS